MWWNKYTLYQKVNYYILVILGFIFILFFIYYIFIRKRLPRDIPFMLTEYYFFILLYLCLGYIFIIYRIIYPSKTNQLLSNIISYIGTPFSTFDSFLKQNKYLYPYFYKVFKYLPIRLRIFSIFKHKFLYISLNIFPRILLVMIFFIDIFWFHNIKNFYLFIPISLLPVFYRYFIYSIEIAILQYLKTLEELYDEVSVFAIESYMINFSDDFSLKESAPYHSEYVTIREFLDIQVNVLLLNNDTSIYEGFPFSKENRYIEHHSLYNKTKLDDEDYTILHHEFNIVMPRLINLQYFLNIQKKVCNNIYLTIINCLIYGTYLCCWSYILFISFNNIPDFSITKNIMEILLNCKDFDEPFTGLFMYKSNTNYISLFNILINYYFKNIYIINMFFFIIVINYFSSKKR